MTSRRDHVPFDARHFETRGAPGPIDETFRHIYETNHWNVTSVSGAGASREQTHLIETALPELLLSLKCEVLLDLPCGDFGWMQHVDLPVARYIGADIVPAIVASNRAAYGTGLREFLVVDLTADPLPRADVMLCRDALVHLSFADALAALRNVMHSDIGYLLTTTFPGQHQNEDITTGDWRPLDLEAPPFGFPRPIQLINERCLEGGGIFRDKSLGLWRVDDLKRSIE